MLLGFVIAVHAVYHAAELGCYIIRAVIIYTPAPRAQGCCTQGYISSSARPCEMRYAPISQGTRSMLLINRQYDRKRTARIFLTCNVQLSAVHFHNLLHGIQTEAGTVRVRPARAL